MQKIFIAGGVSIDSIIYLPEFPAPRPQTIHHCRFAETVGSTGSGKALNLCRLGFDVTLHAMIGDDSYGEKARKLLTHPDLTFLYDIDVSGTERHTNIMNAAGERISVFTNNVSENPGIDYSQFNRLIKESDHVVINLGSYTKKLLPVAKTEGKPVWTDLHDYDGRNPWYDDFVNSGDYIVLSSDNMPDYRRFMQKMIATGKKMVVTTHGRNGSTGLTKNNEWIEVRAVDLYKMADSNGAGDAYFSGLLYGFSKGYGIRKCMEMGSIAGAMCVGSYLLHHPDLSPGMLEKHHQSYFGS